VRLDERKLKLGQYLFLRHGGKVVFFGRFVAVLRTWAAFLAGVNRMPWGRFLFFNAAGGIVWASVFGIGGYVLGDNVERFVGPVGLATAALVAVLTLTAVILVRRYEQRLADAAERALPVDVDDDDDTSSNHNHEAAS
jgi:membrane protein DedA with SNARE-associated domain